MIPNTIHYCWFGGNPKSDLILRCIDSWKKYCPDYEIIEWNESNFDVNIISYVKDAYSAKKWAFVSDYARLWIIYTQGGIYLDTDVLLHNTLDELLSHNCWLASDDVRYVATGLGFGAQKGHPLIKAIMDEYETYSFTTGKTCVQLNTQVLETQLPQFKTKKSEHSQVIDDVLIVGLRDYSKYAKHLYTGTWCGDQLQVAEHEAEIKERLENGQKKSVRRRYKIKRFFRSPKIINFCDRHKKSLFARMYLFFAYDILDCGVWYFIKLAFKKLFGKKK